MRIRYQLAAAIFLTGLLGVCALIGDRAFAVRGILHDRGEARAQAISESIEHLVLPDMRAGNANHMDRVAKSFAGLPGVASVRIFDRGGKLVVAESRKSAPKSGLIEAHTATVDPLSREILGGVQVAISTEKMAENVVSAAWRGLAVGAASLLVLAIVAWGAGIRIGRRLEELDRSVELIDEDKPLILKEGGTDSEVDRLARRFRVLHERLLSEKSERLKLQAFKDDLTNMVIHDMKHPITVLSAVISLLTDRESGRLSGEKMSSLAVVAKRAIGRQDAMIEQLLQFARLKNAEMPLQMKRLALRHFLAECAQANKVVVDQSQLRWSLEIAPGLSERWIHGDPAVLKRLVGNLILNAVEHSPPDGLVTLAARLSSRDPSKVEILIKDEGPGVAPAMREAIFTEGVTSSESPKNAGLGLAFCRLAAQRHCAQLKLVDSEGPGAAFALVIPACLEEPASERRDPPAGLNQS